jgi:alpha-L-fucosidase
MSLSRRRFLAAPALALVGASCISRNGRAAPPSKAAFEPSWDSLRGYIAPQWYRDAKFGIWAHWSAQCVPEQGDWYARNMYLQGEPHYEHHLKTYGHPSQAGFMEIDHQWKAERWNPDELMGLYKAAGAKYFVALANHHDNFDTFDSKHHAWNAVNVGPRKDLVGGWAEVARAHGLRFGVSNHSAHAWHWLQPAYGYDGEGPLAGVRYDAAKLTKADGRGKWWEGLDPQELYTGPNMVLPDGLRSASAVRQWHHENDRLWNESPPPNNPGFVRSWFLRCRDLLEKYRPDLVYFDDTGLPLGQTGLDITAWYYNANRQWHQGRLEAVVHAKNLTPEQRPAVVEDIERGFSEAIRPLPWQTDTCIGEWHYRRSLFEEHRYKSVDTVITRLCDIVSKNGNLLLSIPLRGDGSIDEDERQFLTQLAAWMSLNGEALFGTRPWRVFGEGPTRVKAGQFGEAGESEFTAEDIRFTQKGETLFAVVLDRPAAASITFKSLGAATPGTVERVALVASGTPLSFRRDAAGLTVNLPANLPGEHVFAFKIQGRGLTVTGA